MYSTSKVEVGPAQVVDIKDNFGAYLLLDDTYGIGTVGATGRGYCEYYGVSTDRSSCWSRIGSQC